MEQQAKHYTLTAGLLLVMALCTVLMVLAFTQDRMLQKQTYEQASALFNLILTTREWNAKHGGVFVVKKPGQSSNPYLENPDIMDTAGRVYTKKNPALMTREISEYAEIGKGFSFHITGLRLKNPDNVPDSWEKDALESFDLGEPERVGVIESGGGTLYRLMRPLVARKECLECHRAQNYRVGDVMGGISVNIPFDGTLKAIWSNYVWMAALSGVLMLFLVLILYFFIWRLLDRLSQQKEELAALNETKDRFLGMAAHDLRNPLSVISWAAEIMHGGAPERLQKKSLDIILKASKGMQALVNDLLDVAKIRSGRLDLSFQDVDIADLLAGAAENNAVLGMKKDIRIRPEFSGDLGLFRLDPERFRQVLDNLLGNAVKYSHPGTEVTLGARKSGDRLQIWVEDQGVGVRQDEIAQVFDEFSRTSASPTGGESSHGLGLAVVKKMVEMHGGEVDFRSKPGKGTRVSITLVQNPE